MEEVYVTKEQAIKLSGLGFDCPTTLYIDEVDNNIYQGVSNRNWNSKQLVISLPSLSLVQKWLREVHYLSVEVYSCLDIDSNWEWDSFVKNLNDIFEDEIEDTSVGYQTYEKALEEGINKALEILELKLK